MVHIHTSVSFTRQCSIKVKLRWEIFILVMSHFFLIPTLKEFKKSTNICQSYSKNKSGTVFFDSQCIYIYKTTTEAVTHYQSPCHGSHHNKKYIVYCIVFNLINDLLLFSPQNLTKSQLQKRRKWIFGGCLLCLTSS